MGGVGQNKEKGSGADCKKNQCTCSSSVPRLDSIMVFFAKGASAPLKCLLAGKKRASSKSLPDTPPTMINGSPLMLCILGFFLGPKSIVTCLRAIPFEILSYAGAEWKISPTTCHIFVVVKKYLMTWSKVYLESILAQ